MSIRTTVLGATNSGLFGMGFCGGVKRRRHRDDRVPENFQMMDLRRNAARDGES